MNDNVIKAYTGQRFDSDHHDKTKNIEIEMESDIFIEIAKMAHEKDITFNQMVIQIIKNRLDDFYEPKKVT